MRENSLSAVIREQTARALWSVGNVLEAVPGELWEKPYCGTP